MKMRLARGLLLSAAVVVSCGKGETGGGAVDAGLTGPTDLVVHWTFTGKAASESTCTDHGGSQVYVNVAGTIDVGEHETKTLSCAKGTVTFSGLRVEKLGGMPFVEANLLDEKGVMVAQASANATPKVGTTTVTLDFFPPPMGTGGSMSSSSSSSSSSSGTGGTGGTMGTGGTAGAGGTATTSSTTTTTTGTGGAGGADAGVDGG